MKTASRAQKRTGRCAQTALARSAQQPETPDTTPITCIPFRKLLRPFKTLAASNRCDPLLNQKLPLTHLLSYNSHSGYLLMGFNLRRFLFVPLYAAFCCAQSNAQQITASLPDSPSSALDPSSSVSSSLSTDPQSPPQSPQPDTSANKPHVDEQPKRILGILPNFRAVTAGTKLPPQTVKDKFITASEDSFDYSALFIPAALAGYGLAVNNVPEFHGGAAGYARYYWHSFTDQTIENYMVEFIVPAIHHEDTRYYTKGEGGFVKRTTYALKHAVITQSDSGKPTFNAGEVIGSGAAAGISNFYYPRSQRTFGQTAQRWGVNFGIDAATFVFKEFWPDINHALFHGKE
jgi:hypothetical protein